MCLLVWNERCSRLSKIFIPPQGVGPQEYTLIKMKIVEPYTAKFKSKVFYSRWNYINDMYYQQFSWGRVLYFTHVLQCDSQHTRRRVGLILPTNEPPHHPPQRHKRQEHLPGGCHPETRDHVWTDQLLGEAWHEICGLWDSQWRHLHLHQEVCEEHVLPGLHQREWGGASDHGNIGTGTTIVCLLFNCFSCLQFKTARYLYLHQSQTCFHVSRD